MLAQKITRRRAKARIAGFLTEGQASFSARRGVRSAGVRSAETRTRTRDEGRGREGEGEGEGVGDDKVGDKVGDEVGGAVD